MSRILAVAVSFVLVAALAVMVYPGSQGIAEAGGSTKLPPGMAKKTQTPAAGAPAATATPHPSLTPTLIPQPSPTRAASATPAPTVAAPATATPAPTVAAPATATPVPTTGSLPAGVTVDFAGDQGPVTYRATGFIGADITDTQPPDSLLLPLRPRLLSWVMNWKGINRATQNNIKYQIKLWSKTLIPTSATGDWSKWESYVRTKALEAVSRNYYTAEFDIWNEPEIADYWDGPIDERYYQMWIRAYRQIKSVSSSLVVVGPSALNISWIKNNFLTRMKSENALPDVLSWHEMNNAAGIAQRVQDMRNYMQTQGINISKISINEMLDSWNSKKPGVIVRSMYELEAAKVDSAARACWQEGGDWNCAVHLNNVLTYPDQQKRSAWWTYKAYADMAGRLVPVSGTSTMVGVASEDWGYLKGRVLLGAIGSATSVNVNLTNLGSAPFYSPGAPIKVTIERIPNSEGNPLSAPIIERQTTLTPSGTSLTLTLSNVQQYSAYAITLTR